MTPQISIQGDNYDEHSNDRTVAILGLSNSIDQQTGYFSHASSVKYVIGKENISKTEASLLDSNKSDLDTTFKSSNVFASFLNDADSETINIANKIATETFLQLNAGLAYHNKAGTKPTGENVYETPIGEGADYQTTWPLGALTTNSMLANEAFNPITETNIMAGIAVSQALSLVETPRWLSAWFCTRVMGPNNDGYTIDVTLPHLIQGGTHNADGTYNPTMKKTPLTSVITDPNALSKQDATWVIPYAPESVTSKYLVSKEVMAPIIKVINGVDHPTRGYRYNTTIPSMLGLSQNPLILKGNNFDDTEALHTNILMGEIDWRIKVITNRNTTPVTLECIMRTDISHQANTKLIQQANGEPQQYFGVAEPHLSFSNKSVAYLGTSHIAVAAALRTILGLDADAPFVIEGVGSITMRIHVEKTEGSILTSISDNGIVSVKDGNGNALSLSLLDTPTTYVQIDFKGTNSVTGLETTAVIRASNNIASPLSPCG